MNAEESEAVRCASSTLAASDGFAPRFTVLDLFSAAAGGWSLGMHRAGFRTVAACECVAWRRALYAENNPEVILYDDVRTLTGPQLERDLGTLPDIVVGSPPCQDISSANTKGKGVDGERSGLYFEAVRIIGEVRPRWFALENSPLLRTRGADRLLGELQALGYTVEPCVVGADDIGANHERKRSWLIGFDLAQVSDPDGYRRAVWAGRRLGLDLSIPAGPDLDAEGFGHEGRRSRRHGADGNGSPFVGDASSDGRRQGRPRRRALSDAGLSVEACGDDADPVEIGQPRVVGSEGRRRARQGEHSGAASRHGAHADGEGQPNGPEHDEVALGEGLGGDAGEPWSEWNGGPSNYIRVDARLRAWAFLAILLEEGSHGWAGQRLMTELKSAASVDGLLAEPDMALALRTVLAFYGENIVRNLAPIAETLLTGCNITLEPGGTWEAAARSAAAQIGSASIISTKTGQTEPTTTPKRSARHATQATTCELDSRGAARRAERRIKRFDRRHVEAFGDSVVPLIPEAIGRAILRTEAALYALFGGSEATIHGLDEASVRPTKGLAA